MNRRQAYLDWETVEQGHVHGGVQDHEYGSSRIDDHDSQKDNTPPKAVAELSHDWRL